jgi:membrane-associated protease RseP (regulator of RpoE activity)
MIMAMLMSVRMIGTVVATLSLAIGTTGAQAGRGGSSTRPPVDTPAVRMRASTAQPTLVAQGIAVQERLESAPLDGSEYNQLLGQLKDIHERVGAGVATGAFQIGDVMTLQYRLSPEMLRVSPTQRDRLLRMIVPKGMLGFVATSQSAVEDIRHDAWSARYYEAPEITYVYPDSPADKVGLTIGDKLLAYDNRDIRRGRVNLTTLSEPGKQVEVRVLTISGVPRNVTLVAVPAAPEMQKARLERANKVIDQIRPVLESMTLTIPSFPPGVVNRGGAVRTGDTTRSLLGASAGGRGGAGIGSGRDGVRMTPASGTIVFATARDINTSLHGMRISSLTAQLRDRDGLKNGVYVDSIAPGSFAGAWGFHAGDVIVRVGEQTVHTVSDARRFLVVPAPGQTVKVEIRRKGDKKTVEIKPPKAK